MSEARARFFESLSSRAHAVLPPRTRGTIRFDLDCDGTTEHWYITIAPDGNVEVAQEHRPAEAVFRSKASLFDRISTGETAAIAAVFRNEATTAGNIALFLAFRRFFPSPPGTSNPCETARRMVAQGKEAQWQQGTPQ